MKAFSRIFPLTLLLSFAALQLKAQDWVHTGTNMGQDRIRIAAADFKPTSVDPQTPALKAVFDATLYADLGQAGIFDLVSKSMAPQAAPGSPQEINLPQWAAAPSNAAMVAFGAFSVSGGRVQVSGWLFDANNTVSPQVLARQYNETASEESARTIAHRFADEIILRLGGGINGIAETKIYFISTRSGTKEVWAMDYDGQNQHAITHLGTISISPRISPDNCRLAFASLGRDGWAIRMYSLDLDRSCLPGGRGGGSNSVPAWSADGSKIAFSSSRTGDPEIWVADASGGNLRRLTTFRGPNVAPTWNPRTNAQIAWVSGRTGLPQIYTMDQDGSNIQRMTDGGYAVSPFMVAQRPAPGLQLESQVRPRRPRRTRHLRDGYRQQAWLQITHESGQQRLPFMGAGWPPHRLRAHHRRSCPDLDHAGRRHPAAPTHTVRATTPCQTGAGSDRDAMRIEPVFIRTHTGFLDYDGIVRLPPAQSEWAS